MRLPRRSDGRDRGVGLAAVAAGRLESLARQWRPVSPAREPVVLDDAGPMPPSSNPWRPATPGSTAGRSGSRALTLGPWTASAGRGLAALAVAALALTAWWWWSGRPLAVAVAPTVLSAGASIPGMTSGGGPGAAGDAGGGPSAQVPDDASTPSDPAATLPSDVPVVDSVDVVVHVTGLVNRPGLVTLPIGSRVADAVAAAGGVTRPRAAESVNLARILLDGEQIVVSAEPVAAPSGTMPSAGGVTDVNSADAAALELLPGVGPVLAGRIVAWRVANGPFRSVDELGEVTGIGDAILEQLRPVVRV